MKKIVSFLSIIELSLAAFAFEMKDIVSPAKGTWANVQPLVLNAEEGTDLYYSLSGTDPLVSGFSYDGPVLIDEKGDVSIHITAVSKNGSERQDFDVSYKVLDSEKLFTDSAEETFVNGIKEKPIRKYTSGNEFQIPAKFKYSLSNDQEPVWSGNLYLSELNVIDRYVPCIVTDGFFSYHFVIHIVPSDSNAEVLKLVEVPFEIANWNTVFFSSRDYLYQIDNGEWIDGANPIRVTRDVPHTIRWRTAFGEVFEFGLPSMPEVVCRYENGITKLFLRGDDNYSFANGKEYTADAFFSESVTGNVRLGIYLAGIFQGALEAEYKIDKEPPAAPLISSLRANSRKESSLKISCGESGAVVYYAISSPLESVNGFDESSMKNFGSVEKGEFVRYSGQEIKLTASPNTATFYKVTAYAVDEAGNKSLESEYQVILDESNFYLSSEPSRNSGVPGSWGNPFVSFDHALEAINSTENGRLHVSGKIKVHGSEKKITSSCIIYGSDAYLVFDDETTLSIENSSVEFHNCMFEKMCSQNENSSSFIAASNSSLKFDGCEIAAIFDSDGTAIETEKSYVEISETGITVQSATYSSCGAFYDSSVNIKNSRITSIAQSTMGFNVRNGECKMFGSSATLIGIMGRCLELNNSNAYLMSNGFYAELSGVVRKDDAVNCDENSHVLVNDKNFYSGF